MRSGRHMISRFCAIFDRLAHFASISYVQFSLLGNWYLFCDTPQQQQQPQQKQSLMNFMQQVTVVLSTQLAKMLF